MVRRDSTGIQCWRLICSIYIYMLWKPAKVKMHWSLLPPVFDKNLNSFYILLFKTVLHFMNIKLKTNHLLFWLNLVTSMTKRAQQKINKIRKEQHKILPNYDTKDMHKEIRAQRNSLIIVINIDLQLLTNLTTGWQQYHMKPFNNPFPFCQSSTWMNEKCFYIKKKKVVTEKCIWKRVQFKFIFI